MAGTRTSVHSVGSGERRLGVADVAATLTNGLDEYLAGAGRLRIERVPVLVVDEMLVDTHATTLALPIDMVWRLGLRHIRDVDVRMAAGIAEVGLYTSARLTIGGRSGSFECLALPEGRMPVLGSIPMDMLGVEPDLPNRRLRLLTGTYLMAY